MSQYRKDVPYNDLPLLPPQGNLETTAVLRKAISASRALARLNGMIVYLPNPQLFIDTIYLQEAKASSEIENIITTNDELYKTIVADKKSGNESSKEVISYKYALWCALKELDSKPFITTNLCISIMQLVKENTSGIRTTPGTTLSNARGEVIYTPPSGEKVIRDKLSNWEQFVNTESELDPLIKMAVMHYQFEAIHPFVDGNGRTGRILLLLYLKLVKLLDVPAIYLSQYINQNRAEYYKRLRDVTEKGDWESWILYILEMVEYTAIKGLELLNRVVKLMELMAEKIKNALPKVYSWELIESLYKLPYTKRQYLVEDGLGTLKTVGNYLVALENKGFLRSVKVGKEKLYINFWLLELLEENEDEEEDW